MSTKVNLDTPVVSGAIRIPTTNYKLRVKEEPTFKMSRDKGDGTPQKPMLVFKLEIVEPATLQGENGTIDIAGEEFTLWATFLVNDNGEEYNPTLTAIHRQCQLPLSFERNEESGLPVNDDGVPFSYAGLIIYCKCSSEEYIEKDDTTGEPLVNPLTGEVQKGWSRRVNRVWDPTARHR